MGDLQFAASVVGSLAWPVVVLVAVVLLRRELADALHRMQSLEIAGTQGKLTFATLAGYGKMVEAAARDADVPPARAEETEFTVLEALAAAAPRQAVIDAWSLLEYQLNVASDGLAPDGPHGWPPVARTLEAWPDWPRYRPAVQELRRLRDYTVQSGRPPSAADAASYVAVAQDVVTALRAAVQAQAQPGSGPQGGGPQGGGPQGGGPQGGGE